MTTSDNRVTWADWMVQDRRVPTYLRVTVLAYACADDRDAAYFDPGELARFLGVADRRILHKAVQRAVEVGFLAPTSGSTCLRLAPATGGGK